MERLSITKVFYFEAAHAITNHTGKCKNVHGHNYELHVSVSANNLNEMNMIMDFDELKKIVQESVINHFDHCLLLNRHASCNAWANATDSRVLWMENEPTVEFILLEIKEKIHRDLPERVRMTRLVLFETRSNYATWENLSN